MYVKHVSLVSLDLLPDPCLLPCVVLWPRSAPPLCPAGPAVHHLPPQLLDRRSSPAQAFGLITVYMCTINASCAERHCPLPQRAGHWHPSPVYPNSMYVCTFSIGRGEDTFSWQIWIGNAVLTSYSKILMNSVLTVENPTTYTSCQPQGETKKYIKLDFNLGMSLPQFAILSQF